MPERGDHRAVRSRRQDALGEGMARGDREPPADKEENDGGDPVGPGIQLPTIRAVIKGVAHRPEILDGPIDPAPQPVTQEMQVKRGKAQPPDPRSILRPEGTESGNEERSGKAMGQDMVPAAIGIETGEQREAVEVRSHPGPGHQPAIAPRRQAVAHHPGQHEMCGDMHRADAPAKTSERSIAAVGKG